MNRLVYFFATAILITNVLLYCFLPARNVSINDAQLQKIELYIKNNIKKNIKTFGKTRKYISVSQCVIDIETRIVDKCISYSDNVSRRTRIFLPEIEKGGGKSIGGVVSVEKGGSGNSFIFVFTNRITELLEESERIYMANRKEGLRPYLHGPIITPSEFRFNDAGKKAHEFLIRNNVKSSKIINSCRGVKYNQLGTLSIVIHFKLNVSFAELKELYDAIERYREICVYRANEDKGGRT